MILQIRLQLRLDTHSGIKLHPQRKNNKLNKHHQTIVCGLLILLFVFIVNCSDSIAETAESVRENLDFYKEFILILKNQNEVDYLLKIHDRYTFTSDEIVYSGHFNIAQGKIEQTHYKNIPLTDEYKKIILRWLAILKENNICGFDVRNDTMSSIYILPDLKLLFLKAHDYEDSWEDNPDKWTDYRGVTHFRVDKNTYLIFEK